MRTFIDTNVFLYAAGGVHPQRARCIQVLRNLAEGKIDGIINGEVVQEILYVLSRRGRLEDALKLAAHLSSLFPDLLPVTRADILETCNLLRRYPRLPVRDAIHAATMTRNGITQIISVDRDFDQIDGIRRIAP